MDEYIKRESVLDIVKRTSGDYATAWVEISRLPAEDVAPVVRGKWIEHIDDYENYCECSVCHYIPDAPLDETPRCPSCGAKMDGGEKDATN